MISYAVLVRIGPYEFVKPFPTEQAAVDCFDSIAADPNIAADNGTVTVPANALVDHVTIRRYNDSIDRLSDPANPTVVEPQIGNPNRR